MELRLGDLKWREVIDTATGARLGYVNDILIEAETGRVLALIVPGPPRFFGVFGRDEDYILPWESVARLGADFVLIDGSRDVRRGSRESRPFF